MGALARLAPQAAVPLEPQVPWGAREHREIAQTAGLAAVVVAATRLVRVLALAAPVGFLAAAAAAGEARPQRAASVPVALVGRVRLGSILGSPYYSPPLRFGPIGSGGLK